MKCRCVILSSVVVLGAAALVYAAASTTLTVPPKGAKPNTLVALEGRLRVNGTTKVSGLRVDFQVVDPRGTTYNAGWSNTTSSGNAIKQWTVPASARIGETWTIRAKFAGTSSYAASSGTGTLTIRQ